jgi:nucleolar protein 14
MAKRKSRSKKSVHSLPKGLPVRGGGVKDASNPFEVTQRLKRPKFAVHNRGSTTAATLQRPSALAEALKQRKSAIATALQQQKKANVFHDKRIGEHDTGTQDEKNLARLVRERARQSKRSSKFALQDDSEEAVLTHKGKAIDSLTAADHVMLSDDEEDAGDLDAYDTEMHFGGSLADQKQAAVYGSGKGADMSTLYSQKKSDLDDLILRRKILKAERLKSKEEQADKFEAMDQSFSELAALLNFRDKEKDIREHIRAKRAGTLSTEDQEFADWDKEMKQYLHTERKVAATDRTKTPEEIAKEEADKLHALETRRLARMNGDFDDDDFSDVDSDEDGKSNHSNKRQRKHHKRTDHPEALDNDSDDDDDDGTDQLQTRFTADGLVYVDKTGAVVGKVGSEKQLLSDAPAIVVYRVGDKVTASYRATEQYGGSESWFGGVIVAVHNNTVKDGTTAVTYDIEYDDGDLEEGVESRHVRPLDKTAEELEREASQKDQEVAIKRKRQKAKEKARYDISVVSTIWCCFRCMALVIRVCGRVVACAAAAVNGICIGPGSGRFALAWFSSLCKAPRRRIRPQ